MPARKPNILWIVTTQWRAQALGHAGDPNARTPALDALAAASVNFAEAVTPHPFGPFARAAMLTGVLSPANGVRDYFDPLPRGLPTVAHALGELGYATAFFGKWHLAPRASDVPLVGEAHARTPVAPADRGGFGFWEGFEGGFRLNDPWLHGTRLPEPVRFEGYQSDVLAERTAAWLQAADPDRPWFVLASLEPPHPPYAAPAAGEAPSDPAGLVLRRNVPAAAQERARRELSGYYAHIAATDRAIGRLLAAAGPETTVIFTSVHGDMHGSHGLFRKGWPHEESVRVPLLLRDARERPGVDRAAISLADIPAMLHGLARGECWRPARRHAPISMPSVVALPDQCDRVWRGVRTPAHKLVLNADGSPWLLYDLAADPLEQANLVDRPDAADRLAQLRTLI